MKLMRFVSEKGEILTGLYEKGRTEETKIIEGDIFGEYRLTSQSAHIERPLPPVDPPNIVCVGLNYRRHAEETKIGYPDLPVLFIKTTTSLIGSGDAILLPLAGPDQVDYEAELAVIIGRRAKNVSPEHALDYVLGYSCANDVSARDWQIDKQKKQWARGKSFDTFCPLGPCLVTKDELTDPNNLRLKTILNGKVLQDSNTSDMIFNVQTLVSDLSQSLTLLPGTVILTGTPEGVGFTRQPPVFLREGDIITIEIEGVGSLVNPVRKEQDDSLTK
jgi:2-keto-4-pentenoate hydratase/2-oxohepta-3-ene-1,7-dioic acid hydratase in catechol pathway